MAQIMIMTSSFSVSGSGFLNALHMVSHMWLAASPEQTLCLILESGAEISRTIISDVLALVYLSNPVSCLRQNYKKTSEIMQIRCYILRLVYRS